MRRSTLQRNFMNPLLRRNMLGFVVAGVLLNWFLKSHFHIAVTDKLEVFAIVTIVVTIIGTIVAIVITHTYIKVPWYYYYSCLY